MIMNCLEAGNCGYKLAVTDDCHPHHPLGQGDFTRVVRADAAIASRVTQEVRRWLSGSVHIDEQRTADIVLATYEALSNCVDHAYRHFDSPGHMSVEVTYDQPAETVRVCVTDQGSWADPNSHPAEIGRGRGLRLMHALSTEVTVNGTAEGTTVCLHFDRCPVARADRGRLERAGIQSAVS
jgi:serine/threonine-protein kinase RsbW